MLPVGGITEKRVAARLNGFAHIVEPQGAAPAPDVRPIKTLEQAWNLLAAENSQ